MAQQTVWTDDLDPSLPAEKTAKFAVEGTLYEIDLSRKNYTKFMKSMEQWTTHARVTGGVKGEGRPVGLEADSRRSRKLTSKVRQWAREKGYEVADAGRLSPTIWQAYFEEYPDAEY